MKRMLVLSVALLALPLAAQQQPAPAAQAQAAAPAPAPKQVAIVNGEIITADRLEHLWNNLGLQMREQYLAAGGKPAFLENYLRKRLVIQEAIKSGFDKRADVAVDMAAASESALFDRYVRDVIAGPIVSEADIRKYYDEHPSEFQQPEQIKVRHIVITAVQQGPAAKTKEQALERIKTVATELMTRHMELRANPDQEAAARLRLIYFADAARKHSEDASASSGGDLGWQAKGVFDPKFEEAAWNLTPGVISGIVESQFGYHLILIEDKKPAGTQPYEQVRAGVREYFLNQRAADIMTAVNKLTNELRMTSRITLFPENIK
jgi:peptidyl-prolyl cis-trans isomerase C